MTYIINLFNFLIMLQSLQKTTIIKKTFFKETVFPFSVLLVIIQIVNTVQKTEVTVNVT